jgi:hypothetical protein
MTPPSATPPAIPGYSLHPPTEADARAALERVFGAERAAERWAEACRSAGLAAGRVSAGAPFERVVDALLAQGGATEMVARSIVIRQRTYNRLAANAAASTGAPR